MYKYSLLDIIKMCHCLFSYANVDNIVHSVERCTIDAMEQYHCDLMLFVSFHRIENRISYLLVIGGPRKECFSFFECFLSLCRAREIHIRVQWVVCLGNQKWNENNNSNNNEKKTHTYTKYSKNKSMKSLLQFIIRWLKGEAPQYCENTKSVGCVRHKMANIFARETEN